jgi:hypothetical protein
MFLLCLISAVQIVNANGFQSNLTAREKQKSAFNTMQREESSENPPDVSFTIRLTEGKAISAGWDHPTWIGLCQRSAEDL